MLVHKRLLGNNFKLVEFTLLQKFGNINGITLRSTCAAIGANADTVALLFWA